jgi:hypothetical protein
MRTQAHKEHIMRLAHDSTAAGCLAVVVVLDVTRGEGRGGAHPPPRIIRDNGRRRLVEAFKDDGQGIVTRKGGDPLFAGLRSALAD